MGIPFMHGPGTVGREDRLVRGCIALSLILLAGFAVLMSGESSVVTVSFLVLGLYFTVTAALGRDPFYARFGIDTRSEAELAHGPDGHERWDGGPTAVVDLRTGWPALADDRPDSSRLGS